MFVEVACACGRGTRNAKIRVTRMIAAVKTPGGPTGIGGYFLRYPLSFNYLHDKGACECGRANHHHKKSYIRYRPGTECYRLGPVLRGQASLLSNSVIESAPQIASTPPPGSWPSAEPGAEPLRACVAVRRALAIVRWCSQQARRPQSRLAREESVPRA